MQLKHCFFNSITVFFLIDQFIFFLPKCISTGIVLIFLHKIHLIFLTNSCFCDKMRVAQPEMYPILYDFKSCKRDNVKGKMENVKWMMETG
ncbi:hypothetical protein DRW42_15975 [Pedobacter miscanthi]|uniref:Uncharacterized protein n=1 Tax=Pedobacter miscanthi TaxID=2259170 RepID=A0A366KV27_9SPHI|nr:hypothetical protein DRW42_15975 [Pedobacter miscanthi]